jgi:hypothetical protein
LNTKNEVGVIIKLHLKKVAAEDGYKRIRISSEAGFEVSGLQ